MFPPQTLLERVIEPGCSPYPFLIPADMMNQSRTIEHTAMEPKGQRSGSRSGPRPGSRWFWASALASVGVVMGWAPGLTPSFDLALGSVAYAQTKPAPATAEEIANFVRAALSIEPKRKQAVQDIQAVMGRVPAIRCDDRNSFNGLDPRVRGVAINYCNDSKRIVETNFKPLTIERFNQILLMQREDDQLRDRVQAETCRIDANLCRNR